MKTYRGQSKTGAGLGRFILGKGIYTTTSKAAAKEYAKLHDAGEVVEVENAIPTNPMCFDSYEAFQGWLFAELEKLNMKSIREFNAKYPDTGTYIKSLGYNGVKIGKGKDVDYVKYTDKTAYDLLRSAWVLIKNSDIYTPNELHIHADDLQSDIEHWLENNPPHA